MDFLLLPAELRILIYEFLLPQNPLSVPRAYYNGLLNACQTTRQELKPQIIERASRCLAKLLQSDAQTAIDFTAPKTLHDVYNLSVRLLQSRLSC